MVTDDFIEKLETLAWERKECDIVYSSNGGKVVLHDRIDTVYEKDTVLYLRVMTGIDIPVDNLIRVDGMPAQNFC